MRAGGSRDCLCQRCIACVGICTDVYFVELMIRTRSLDSCYHGQLICMCCVHLGSVGYTFVTCLLRQSNQSKRAGLETPDACLPCSESGRQVISYEFTTHEVVTEYQNNVATSSGRSSWPTTPRRRHEWVMIYLINGWKHGCTDQLFSRNHDNTLQWSDFRN